MYTILKYYILWKSIEDFHGNFKITIIINFRKSQKTVKMVPVFYIF